MSGLNEDVRLPIRPAGNVQTCGGRERGAEMWFTGSCWSLGLALGFVLAALTPALTAQTVDLETVFEVEQASALNGLTFSRYAEGVAEGGDGDWLRFDGVHFPPGGYDSAAFLATKKGGGTLSLRLDRPDGQEIASVAVSKYGTVTYRSALASVAGVHDLYLVFSGNADFGSVNRFILSGTLAIDPGAARTYYVDAARGSDIGNDGLSPERPFRTLGKAAALMQPGSRCVIREGVYREMLRPLWTGFPGAPLTFEAWPGEKVFISAADPITGWSLHRGNIHKARMPWSMGSTDRNQIFVDGVGMYLARTPNAEGPCIRDEKYEGDKDQPTTRCLLDRQKDIHPLLIPPMQRFSDCGAYVPNLSLETTFTACFSSYETAAPGLANAPADQLKGGIFHAYATRYWSTMGRILSSDPSTDTKGKLLVQRYAGANMASPKPRAGFVYDVLSLLDAPNEWYWDPRDSTVYLWLPGSGAPKDHVIEGKRRLLVSDLRGKSHIVLRGLHFLGGSMTMASATDCLIENCHFREISHIGILRNNDEIAATGYGSDYDPTSGYKGIYVSGRDNTFRRSSIAVSWASGLILDGMNQTVENCRIHDCNIIGSYDAPIYILNKRFTEGEGDGKLNGTGHRIERNSLYNASRELIHLSTSGATSGNPFRIRHNDFHGFLLNSYEGGAIYTYGDAGAGTDLSYNWFHGQGPDRRSNAVCQDVGHRSPWYIHHNVYWAGKSLTARRLHAAFYVDSTKNVLYNNTIVDPTDWRTKSPDDTSTGFRWADGGANTLYAAGDTATWKFRAPNAGDFSLTAGSPAIDAGVPVPGHLEIYQGKAPDLGAYEYGEPQWAAGADWEEPAWEYVRAARSTPIVRPAVKAAPVRHGLRRIAGHLLLSSGWMPPYEVVLVDSRGRRARYQVAAPEDGGALRLPIEGLPGGVYQLRLTKDAATWSRPIFLD